MELHHVLEPVRLEQAVIYKIENAAAEAVRVMERNRVMIDVPYCRRMWAYLDQELRYVQADIYRIAGRSFDIDSPKQCGGILFDVLKLPNLMEKKASGQYDTSAEHLEKLQDQHPVCKLILSARSLAKSRSTYVERLIEAGEADPRGAKFCFFNTRVPTGRMAAGSGGDGSGYAQINVQSIPATYSAKEIDAMFVESRPGQPATQKTIPVGRQFIWDELTVDDLVNISSVELAKLLDVPQCLAPVVVRPESLTVRILSWEEIPDSEVKHLQGGGSMPTEQEADDLINQMDPNAGKPKNKDGVGSPAVMLSDLQVEAKPAPSIVDEVLTSTVNKVPTAEASGLSVDDFVAEPPKVPDRKELDVGELLSEEQISMPKPPPPPPKVEDMDLGDLSGSLMKPSPKVEPKPTMKEELVSGLIKQEVPAAKPAMVEVKPRSPLQSLIDDL